ncbi:SAF domain-containing protein [Mycobacterium sp. pV006]|uniref:SAF domain-containing protein n=1 Tax=Mycobacterium sp. pV006 TaxID=3238983 RepID=UPI00351B14E9
MGDSLNPTVLGRLTALRPDWSRTRAARQTLAAALVLLAAAAAWRDDPRADHTEVVVASGDLSPGTALTRDDVRLESRRETEVPDGAQTDIDAVVGATLAGPSRRGEIVTDIRLLGPRLAESSAGPGARIVPVPLADPAVLDLIRVGDVVDIVAAPVSADADSDARLIATDAVVVLVSEQGSGLGAPGGDRVVLVALPAAAARTVAGAALVSAVTVTLH